MASSRLKLRRDERLRDIVFPAGTRPRSRAELHRRLGPALRRWIAAACLWEEGWAIGDHRFVVFSIDVAPDVQVYVQFWSEPLEPVLWEVSSGCWHEPTGRWLAGAPSERIEMFGFTRTGEAENYTLVLNISTRAQAAAVAARVVDICHDAFGYVGLQPLVGQLVYESRAEARLTYDSFSTDDLAKIAVSCGFAVESAGDGGEHAPALHLLRRGARTILTCADRVPEDDLFRRAVLVYDAGGAVAPDRTEDDPLALRGLSTTLVFDGGVTVSWVGRRLHEWDAAVRALRRAHRGRRTTRRGEASARRRKTIH